MEPSLEIHTPVTNGGAIDWYRSILSNGKISEEKIKTEAGKFFNLSFEDKTKDKFFFSKFAWKAFSNPKRTLKQIL